MFVILSHTLTEDQKKDAMHTLGVSEFILLKDVNPELQEKVSNFDPELSTDDVYDLAIEVYNTITEVNPLFVCMQGEAGLQFLVWTIITSAENRHIIIAQSTTKRTSVDILQPDGAVKKVSEFKHIQWRLY